MATFLKLKEFDDWFKSQTPKVRAQIDARLLRLQESEHEGHIRRLSKILKELKFNNGNRIYFTEKVVGGHLVILILGGNKNGQDKDIKKAQKIAEQIHQD